MTLQQSMPAPLFNLIYQAYMAMRVQGMKTAAAGGGGGVGSGAGLKTAKKDEPEVDWTRPWSSDFKSVFAFSYVFYLHIVYYQHTV